MSNGVSSRFVDLFGIQAASDDADHRAGRESNLIGALNAPPSGGHCILRPPLGTTRRNESPVVVCTVRRVSA
jgi:hypothetical protein